MFLPIALFAALVIFFGQLIVCLRGNRLWLKLLPLFLLVTGELICWGVVIVSEYITLPYGAAFAGYIYALILLVFLIAVAGAWGIWGLVKTVQKRRK